MYFLYSSVVLYSNVYQDVRHLRTAIAKYILKSIKIILCKYGTFKEESYFTLLTLIEVINSTQLHKLTVKCQVLICQYT